MSLGGEVVRMNTDKCIGKFLLGKSERGHSEYKGLDRKANIKTDVKGSKYLDRIHLAQNRNKWALANTAMNPPVPKKFRVYVG
jgi:hypothetical protein